MTIGTEPEPLSYNGDGSTKAFSITWKFFAKAHVVATLRATDGSETTQVLNTNYTLTAAGVEAGGTLTMTIAPAVGETLVIGLEPPNTQDKSLPLGGPFPSTSVEAGLDITAQRDSKLEALFDRTVRVPKTDTAAGGGMELPIDSTRASKFLAFDNNGDPIAAAGTSADLTPVSAFINDFLDDADAETARATLGAPTTKIKSAEQTTTATNYVDDAHLVFAAKASTSYLLELVSYFRSTGTFDDHSLAIQLVGPSGSTYAGADANGAGAAVGVTGTTTILREGQNESVPIPLNQLELLFLTSDFTAGDSEVRVTLETLIVIDTTAGDVKVQFSKGASGTGTLAHRPGSFLRVTKVSN